MALHPLSLSKLDSEMLPMPVVVLHSELLPMPVLVPNAWVPNGSSFTAAKIVHLVVGTQESEVGKDFDI